jgi:MoaA/NifB/PqqE/SkfB family radical SAM enzyme
MLEIAVSNKCNSRCRMCDPKHSSLWKKTEDNLKTAGVVSYNIEKLLKSITGTQVNTIKYLGGEPLLTDEIENIFNFIKNHSDNKIKFYINTNLTVSPEKFETQLLNADEIFVGYSIDGTERVNEFIRDGCKWDSVVKNLEKWEDFFKNNNKKSMRYIHTVVQAYNFHNIEQLNNFSKEFNLEHNPVLIKDPVEFTLNSLPPEYIEKHKNNYNSSFIKDYKYNYKLNKMLVEKTKYQDLILKKSIDKYIPELSDVLKK